MRNIGNSHKINFKANFAILQIMSCLPKVYDKIVI